MKLKDKIYVPTRDIDKYETLIEEIQYFVSKIKWKPATRKQHNALAHKGYISVCQVITKSN